MRVSLGSLASNAIEEGRVHDGQIWSGRAFIQRDLDDRVELAVNLSHAAETLVAMGRPSPAAQLIAASQALSEELGGSYPCEIRMNDRTLQRLHAQLDSAAFDAAWNDGTKLAADQAWRRPRARGARRAQLRSRCIRRSVTQRASRPLLQAIAVLSRPSGEQ